MKTVTDTLISITTSINILNASASLYDVHRDFLDAMTLVAPHTSISEEEEAAAFREVIRRRGLIQTA